MAEAAKNLDNVVEELALSDGIERKRKIAEEITNIAYAEGVYPSSIHQLYTARGREGFGGFTVPAINIRTMTYDLARAMVRTALRINAGAFIFEIAKSEMAYTAQLPAEYAALCLAAAVKEGYKGPIFIQGDHFQINARKFKNSAKEEIGGIKSLIEDAVASGFYNIDIDSSTLVDLSQPTAEKQQENNCSVCADITNFIRSIQPEGIEISVGGEIGEVGGQNSTLRELRAFMKGYQERLKEGNTPISKISVQTGTSHGGVVLPDGTIARVKLDFDTLRNLSRSAREEFGMAGAVQHGASTLPPDAFGKFPEVQAAEVHLATEFQNLVYDSRYFPSELKERIYTWIKDNMAGERKDKQTEEQFIYKTRKKALGPFKKDILSIPRQIRDRIVSEVEAKFEFLFDKLNIRDTKPLVLKHVTLKKAAPRKNYAGRIAVDAEGDD